MSRRRDSEGPATPPPLTEHSIQLAIADWLRWQGYRVSRQNSGALPSTTTGRPVRFGEQGWPDLLAIKAGHATFIEVKRPGEKPRPEQLEMHAELRHYGATVIVATCVEDVMRALEQAHAA